MCHVTVPRGTSEDHEPSQGPEHVRKTDAHGGGSRSGIPGPERDPGIPKRMLAIADPPRAG
jgi:hypothetical protein